MDYRCLFEILPKAPSTWSTDDVLAWLNFINFNKYGSVFSKTYNIQMISKSMDLALVCSIKQILQRS